MAVPRRMEVGGVSGQLLRFNYDNCLAVCCTNHAMGGWCIDLIYMHLFHF